MHHRIRDLAIPAYVATVEHSDEIVAAVRQNTAKLENEGYHAQVLVENDYFPLFYITEDGRRLALRRIGDGVYRSKDKDREFTRSELVEIAKNEPQSFSPGVMLRPVIQDHLLPTVCYFGGAAEIAYFAQNAAAYQMMGRPVTPIFHRQSFTVVDSRDKRILEKFDIELPDMFTGFEARLREFGDRQLSPQTVTAFDDGLETINGALDRIDGQLKQLDPTLSASLVKRRAKILYHLAVLRRKTVLAQIRTDETAERQLRTLFNALFPNGELQERVLNVNSFLNKYGPHFIDWIYGAIDLNNKDHQVIFL